MQIFAMYSKLVDLKQEKYANFFLIKVFQVLEEDIYVKKLSQKIPI